MEELQTEAVENEETNESEVKDDVINKDETADETVARALKELQDEGDGGDGGENEVSETENEVDNEPAKEEIKTKGKGKKEPKFDADLVAPERFNAEQKELFNKIPYKGLKKAIHKTVRELQSMATKDKEAVDRDRDYYSGIHRAIKPHLDEWGKMNLSAEGAIVELIGTQNSLTKNLENGQPDLNTRKRTLIAIAKNIGLGGIIKSDDSNAQNGSSAPAVENEEIKSLRAELLQLRQSINPVTSHYEQSLQSQKTQANASLTAEFNGVKNEMDANGKYRYPGLHDDAIIQKIQEGSLIQAFVKTFPGISYSDALKKAHDTVTGSSGNLSQTNQIKPIANEEINKRAINANVSVRGKSAPASSGNGMIEMPESAKKSPSATVAWLLANPSAHF